MCKSILRNLLLSRPTFTLYFTGIDQLYRLLAGGDIDGIVLDRYIYNLFKINIDNEAATYDESVKNMFYNQTEASCKFQRVRNNFF